MSSDGLMKECVIIIRCPIKEADDVIGGPARPFDIEAKNFRSPVEVVLLLQLAQGAVQQKLADQARVVVPPFILPKKPS